MRVEKTNIDGCIILNPSIHGDTRGFFLETYQKRRYFNLGITEEFVQDNRSRSTRNVLRGLHFQKTKPQGKLVSVTQGEVYDVAVDLRVDSNTFGQHVGVILSASKNNQMYVPPGFAHGFCVISDVAEFSYKCTDYYDPEDESGIFWEDNDLAIAWPVENPVISQKDLKLQSFKFYHESLSGRI